jgi:plastocyanin
MRLWGATLAAVAIACVGPAAALAQAPGVQRLKFRYGPISVAPGQNTISLGPNTERPPGNGFIVRMKPDLERADGSVPPVDVIHLHHGVWLNQSGRDATGGGGNERFFASGEEKTIFELPPGYGYPVRANDSWLMNHMVHNLTPNQDQVWITYEFDWVPADSDLGRRLKPVRPIWMDVQNGSAYPVFDTLRGSGGDGRLTYPDEAPGAYGQGRAKNEWTVDRNGTLVSGAGHLHPGGLWTDLSLIRPGTRTFDVAGHRRLHDQVVREHKRGHKRLKRVSKRKRAAEHERLHRRLDTMHRRGHRGLEKVRDSVDLFRSEADYYDPNGPVSWDMSMTHTDRDWRVGVKKGDRLRLTATYETRRASWYESMGIMLLFMADEAGPDPFESQPDTHGEVTHGHLAENGNHGGEETGLPDPAKLGDGPATTRASMANFVYVPGDLSAPGFLGSPPVIRPGQRLRFDNGDSPQNVYHSITACRAPCNRSTGISYPLADGEIQFDSGQLGYGPPGFTAAANRSDWATPAGLKAGTYTYFCRVHPFMRGAFRVSGQ